MKRLTALFLSVLMLTALFAQPVSAATQTGSLSNFKQIRQYDLDKFADVDWDTPFVDNIMWAYDYDLMNGATSNTFDVKSNITLLASIIIASRIHCVYMTGNNTIEKDYAGTLGQKYLAYAKAHGIYCNFSSTSRAATRAEYAEILSSALPDEALTKIGTVEDNAIPDVKVSDAHASAIYRLYRAGVLNGSDRYGTFKPGTNITRGAACAIATRLAGKGLRVENSMLVSDLKTANVVYQSISFPQEIYYMDADDTLDLQLSVSPKGYRKDVTYSIETSDSNVSQFQITDGKLTYSDEYFVAGFAGPVSCGTCSFYPWAGITATTSNGLSAQCQVFVYRNAPTKSSGSTLYYDYAHPLPALENVLTENDHVLYWNSQKEDRFGNLGGSYIYVMEMSSADDYASQSAKAKEIIRKYSQLLAKNGFTFDSNSVISSDYSEGYNYKQPWDSYVTSVSTEWVSYESSAQKYVVIEIRAELM